MQTIIRLTDNYSDSENIIFPVTDLKHVNKELFDTGELEYMKSFLRDHKQKNFSFNRLGTWLHVLLIERESEKSARLETYRETGAKITPAVNEHKIDSVIVVDAEDKPEEILAFAEGMALKNYQFLKYKSKPDDELNTLSTIYIGSKKVVQEEVDRLNIVVDAVSRARNMVNEPVATLNAVALAGEIEKMGKESGALVEVFNRKKIESLKMGGLLAVNRGSVDPPTFSIIEWKPENAVNKKPVVLVGKGVVYDTGGMNIKTGNFMNDMKMDMAGGAAVASAVYAVAKAKVPMHVIALVPATDNRTHGNAYVSGDVITMYDGTRVEVINTDAEGRMLLADALGYAKKYDPELVIDVATLTGSAMRAIGNYGVVGMQSNAGKEFNRLKQCGEEVYERLVEFPLWKEYAEELKSDIADIKHLGGSNAGAITAGKFLEHFTDYPFIHLDIAGPAFMEKAYKYYPAGGSGIVVRLLFKYLLDKTV